MFKPDSFGSTYFFVDMDYDMDNGGVKLAYTEIARNIKIGKIPVEFHVEFNGGNFVSGTNNFGGYIARAWIGGVNYPFAIGNVFCSAMAGYKNIYGTQNGADFQITGTWFTNLLNNKLTLTGFIDIWSEDKAGTSEKKMVILTEPQIWYNVTRNLGIGGEIEISKNFITTDGDFDIMPAVGLKWNF